MLAELVKEEKDMQRGKALNFKSANCWQQASKCGFSRNMEKSL